MTKVTIVLRVHVWDEACEMIAKSLEASTSREIVVVADETNGPVAVPPRFRKISHSLETFEEQGLPLFPTPQRTMWWNGDYVLFQLLDALDSDYVFMFEGDCAVRGPLDPVIDQLVAEGIDYAAHDFQERDPHFYFYRTTAPHFGPIVYSGIFYAVWIERGAIASLRAERLRMKERREKGELRRWAFCEAFVATHLALAGFRCAPLENFVNLDDCVGFVPKQLDEVFGTEQPAKAAISHPVYTSSEFHRRAAKKAAHKWAKVRTLATFWRKDTWKVYGHDTLRLVERLMYALFRVRIG